MKHIKNTLLFFTLFFIYDALPAQVRIQFINTTGKTLDSLTINRVFVGHLDKDSVASVSFKSILSDNGFAYFLVSAFADKQTVEPEKPVFFCGTQMETLTTGSFTYYLKYFTGPKETFIAPDLRP